MYLMWALGTIEVKKLVQLLSIIPDGLGYWDQEYTSL